MRGRADVQYGRDAASLYDEVLGSMMPADATLRWISDRLRDLRVLDLGVGRGRIAIPLAGIALSVVGIDNSQEMLKILQRKSIPSNLAIKRAEFRDPLPFEQGASEAALSTLGSFAYVRSDRELLSAFLNLASVLAPRSPFFLEYYSREGYEALERLGTLKFENTQHPSSSEVSVALDGPVLTMRTLIVAKEGGKEALLSGVGSEG